MVIERKPVEVFADRAARGLVRHWSLLLSALLLIYAALPWLSPLLRKLGYEQAGRAIFRMYTAFCHQLPERSFFWSGYQVCYCHRCTALYTGLFLMSLLYSIGRWRHTISTRLMLLLTIPMVIDGVWHMLDDALPMALRSSESDVGSLNFWLRMITGVLFACGVILWSYPRVQRELATA